MFYEYKTEKKRYKHTEAVDISSHIGSVVLLYAIRVDVLVFVEMVEFLLRFKT